MEVLECIGIRKASVVESLKGCLHYEGSTIRGIFLSGERWEILAKSKMRAAQALGRIGDRRAVEALIDLIEEHERPVAFKAAVEALGSIERPSEPIVSASSRRSTRQNGSLRSRWPRPGPGPRRTARPERFRRPDRRRQAGCRYTGPSHRREVPGRPQTSPRVGRRGPDLNTWPRGCIIPGRRSPDTGLTRCRPRSSCPSCGSCWTSEMRSAGGRPTSSRSLRGGPTSTRPSQACSMWS